MEGELVVRTFEVLLVSPDVEGAHNIGLIPPYVKMYVHMYMCVNTTVIQI